MENSIDEAETQQSFRSPLRRRRSTFFERRESIAPPAYTEEIDSKTLRKDSENDVPYQNLSTYYDKLMSEKEQWKNEVNDRRHKYHDLRQQYQMAVKAPSKSRMSYAALSNEDIEFLKGKPNISKLVDSQQKLHKSIKETMALVKKANELDNVVLSFCEEKVNRITQHILEHSCIE